MLRCCLCRSLDASYSYHDKSRLGLLLDHAAIHTSQIDRFAKPNIFKAFADCFPKIAEKCTIREMVDSMEDSQDSGSTDDPKVKFASMPTERKRKISQRQETVSVKNTEKRSLVEMQGKSERPAKGSTHEECRKILNASCAKNRRRFRCDLCNELVVMRASQKDGFQSWYAINHALSRHMDIKPFRCRHCDYTAKSRSSMSWHVKKAHQTADYRSIHFIDQIDAHQTEICDMVAKCFSKKQWKAIKSESLTKIKITRKYEDATLVATKENQSAANDGKKSRSRVPSAIRDHCLHTLSSYGVEKQCGMCGLFISLRSSPTSRLTPTLAIQHAVAHTGINLFRCRYCSVAMKTHSAMCYHVKHIHKVGASNTNRYDNEMSVHEKEIRDMITYCFGKLGQMTPGTSKSVKVDLHSLPDTKQWFG